MKKKIHPKYHDNTLITCACGNTVVAGSTRESVKTELCSACHPFYTGKQKLVDTAGMVDKFRARQKAAKKHQEGLAAKSTKKPAVEEEAAKPKVKPTKEVPPNIEEEILKAEAKEEKAEVKKAA